MKTADDIKALRAAVKRETGGLYNKIAPPVEKRRADQITNDMVKRAAQAAHAEAAAMLSERVAKRETAVSECGYSVGNYRIARAALEAALNPPPVNKRDGEHG